MGWRERPLPLCPGEGGGGGSAVALNASLEGYVGKRGSIARFNGDKDVCDVEESLNMLVHCSELHGAEQVFCDHHEALVARMALA